MSSPGCCSRPACASAWTARGAGWTTFFIERLWHSLKHEEVYLKAYDSIPEARRQIGAYFQLYNRRRPH